MEPTGLAIGVVGLAGLFSVCLDVIDKADSYKDYGMESRLIAVQFEADKHLFAKWAHDVGIDSHKPESSHHSSLDDLETNLIVEKVLSSIQEIFTKTEGTVSSLQPTVESGPTSLPDGIYFRNIRQKAQNSEGAISKRSRIGWALRKKQRFIYQVQQFGALVQKLQSLVPSNSITEPVNMHRGTIGSDPSSGDGM